MGIEIKVDTSELERALSHAKRQIPFACSLALNKTAEDIRAEVVKELPRKYTLRSKWWKPGTRYGINVHKSNKRDLSAKVFTRADWMALHETGGIKRPQGRHIAIPTENVRKTKAQRITSAKRPRALKRAFIIPTRSGPVLFQRFRKRVVRAMYFLERQARIKPTFEFEQTARSVADKVIVKNMEEAVGRALETAK